MLIRNILFSCPVWSWSVFLFHSSTFIHFWNCSNDTYTCPNTSRHRGVQALIIRHQTQAMKIKVYRHLTRRTALIMNAKWPLTKRKFSKNFNRIHREVLWTATALVVSANVARKVMPVQSNPTLTTRDVSVLLVGAPQSLRPKRLYHSMSKIKHSKYPIDKACIELLNEFFLQI